MTKTNIRPFIKIRIEMVAKPIMQRWQLFELKSISFVISGVKPKKITVLVDFKKQKKSKADPFSAKSIHFQKMDTFFEP